MRKNISLPEEIINHIDQIGINFSAWVSRKYYEEFMNIERKRERLRLLKEEGMKLALEIEQDENMEKSKDNINKVIINNKYSKTIIER